MTDFVTSITFVHNGRELELTRARVVEAARKLTPRSRGTHKVNVDGRWFPVNQIFAAAVGIPQIECSVQVSRDKFSKLGFELDPR